VCRVPFPEILLSLAAVVGVVSLVEVVSWAVIVRRPEAQVTRELTELYPVQPHADYGWVLRPNLSHRAAKALEDGRVCYDVIYHTDALGRRTIPELQEPDRPHLLLFGGSTVMGEGLADEETLQYASAQRLIDYVFNYAITAYSHMLARLESGLPAQSVHDAVDFSTS
jgi:hypothetical protein